MLSFEVRKTGGESEVRKVHRDVIHIGASTGNDLVVRARGVLGRHARISVAGEELRLEVLGSAPGSDVTLNGSIVKTAALAAGDRIAIGEATITLLNGPAPNPNRIAAPPPRGRDALSLATAALSPLAPAPAPAPANAPAAVAARPARSGRASRRGPGRGAAAGGGAVHARSLAGILQAPPPAGPLRRAASGGHGLHRVGDASAQPRVRVAASSERRRGDRGALEGNASAPLGPEPRGGARESRALGGLRIGRRLRAFPVPRPAGESVGLLLVPAETVSDPALLDFVAHAAAAVGFVHGERSEAAFGERGASLAPAPFAVPLEDPLALLVGGSLALSNLKASLSRVAAARAPILLVGDVGSGKTLVAETLHALSPRRSRPLVRVSATAASPQALEEDLLGAPAAGDRRRRVGRLFEADGGTLLVEEVGDLPAPTQALLFRLLEAREVTAPGGRTVPVDVRVIGTTSRPLTRAVEDGAFRDDLYFRLSALTLRLPPLKDRKEDIPALLDALAARHGGPAAEHFDVEAMNALLNYQYPGNVRELENEVRRLAAQIGPGAITLADLDQKFSGEHVELALKESDDLKEIVEKVERQVIERVMRKVRGNQSLGARLLNISRGSLIAKMKEYDIKDFRYLKRGD